MSASPAKPPAERTRPHPLRTWGRLLRVPNLFTVPGDPLAGFLLASGGVLGWKVLGAVAASLCLYAAGLLLNDYFDREVDARERPERPIPSGAVRPRTVLVVGGLLLIVGVATGCCVGGPVAGVVAALTALAVFAYDAGLKRIPLLGVVLMGLCRALSVAIGAATATGGVSWGADAQACAFLTWGYIVVVSQLAVEETSRAKVGVEVFGACTVLGVVGLLMMTEAIALVFLGHVRLLEAPGVHALVALAMAAAVVRTARAAVRVRRGAMAVPPFVGRLIRALIPAQGAWSLWALRSAPAPALALGLVAFFAILAVGAEISSRRFYGS